MAQPVVEPIESRLGSFGQKFIARGLGIRRSQIAALAGLD